MPAAVGGGYDVDPAGIMSAGTEFLRIAEELRQTLRTFLSGADISDLALGSLPESGQAAGEYRALLGRTSANVEELINACDSAGSALHQTAMNYQAAEDANQFRAV